ncbi:MAG: hypothetical protein WD851_01490 [Pirellulales bacterium]
MRPQSLSCILLLCAGCGDGLPVAPVSGTVTFEGKPLVGASITTQPIASGSDNPGSGSFGNTDEQGRFELELVQPAVKGAIIGEHRVMISQASKAQSSTIIQKTADGEEFRTDDPNAHRAGISKWPAEFTNGSLQLTVPPEGRSDANFDLTLKAGR